MTMIVLPMSGGSGGMGITSINAQTGAAISIVGTANRITVSTAGDTLTLSCPQNIATTSSPTFAGLTLTAFSGFVQATAGVLSAAAIQAADVPSLNTSKLTAGTLPVARGGTNSSTALNSDRMILSVAGAIVEGGALTDAQFFAGRTGATPAATSILGTANQIVATFGANAITLSCPQNIATTSDVTFNSVTTTAALAAGTTLTVGTDVTFTAIGTGTGTALVRTMAGAIVELTSTSRHKENIQPLRKTIEPSAILALEGKTFNYKHQSSKEELCFGFLAEEVAAISEDLVIFDINKKPYSLQYNEFIPVMLEILKDHKKEIDTLKSKDVPKMEPVALVTTVKEPMKWTASDYLKAVFTLGLIRPK